MTMERKLTAQTHAAFPQHMTNDIKGRFLELAVEVAALNRCQRFRRPGGAPLRSLRGTHNDVDCCDALMID
jgi:hypothetical protein